MCVEPGRFAAGTAFITIERHLLGDEHPYLLRTDDFGASWHSIAGNLPENQFARAIRQDPHNPALLYAGTNRGVWVTFDGGASWQPLRLNMPATAIYDLEMQTAANDLVVASHGRGVWILDDLTALQQWQGAQTPAVTLYQPRDAVRMWQWPPVNTFTDPKVPPNEFVGPNAPGAIVTYYLARAPKAASIAILDANGKTVAHLESPNVPRRAGINRASWDLNEDGPVKWNGTYEENRGPAEGPEVVPGTYTVALTADGVVADRPLVVKVDPRDPDLAQARRRHAFLTQVFGELSAVDTMLNAIDARLKSATPAQRARLIAFKHRLTYDPINIEDLNGPAQLREHLLDLLSRMGTSYAAPNAAQLAQAAAYQATLDEIQSAYKGI